MRLSDSSVTLREHDAHVCLCVWQQDLAPSRSSYTATFPWNSVQQWTGADPLRDHSGTFVLKAHPTSCQTGPRS
jgi:hypothetical protein